MSVWQAISAFVWRLSSTKGQWGASSIISNPKTSHPPWTHSFPVTQCHLEPHPASAISPLTSEHTETFLCLPLQPDCSNQVKRLNRNKVAGPDGVSPRFQKACVGFCVSEKHRGMYSHRFSSRSTPQTSTTTQSTVISRYTQMNQQWSGVSVMDKRLIVGNWLTGVNQWEQSSNLDCKQDKGDGCGF